jgi:hypothetical protein
MWTDQKSWFDDWGSYWLQEAYDLSQEEIFDIMNRDAVWEEIEMRVGEAIQEVRQAAETSFLEDYLGIE